MIHGKQQILLYSLLVTLSSGQAYGALAGVSASALLAGDTAATYSFVANQAIQEALGQGASGSASGIATSGSESLRTNISTGQICDAIELFAVPEAPMSSTVPSSDSNHSEISKMVELREANDLIVHGWVNNPAMIQYISKAVSNPAIEKALQSLPVVAPSVPSRVPDVPFYGDALFYAATRQQYAFLMNNFSTFGIIPPSDVEILSPTHAKSIVVATPPVTYDVQFLPKQKMYLLISYLAQNNSLAPKAIAAISDHLAAINYGINAQGKTVKLWKNMTASEKRFNLNVMRTFVDETVVKMRANYGKLQQAISATLQAQDIAERRAQGSAQSLWEEFQKQFDIVQDSGVFNWLKYKWSGQQNPRFAQLFIGSDLPIVQQYVEGALEVFASELTIYSSIAKMGESDLSTEFAKNVMSDNGQRLLQYMIFGGAVIAGGSAAMSDSDEGVKARLHASYIVMQLKMANGAQASSAELVKTFGELAWYSVTGKVLNIDPRKSASAVALKAGKLAQDQAKEMIENPGDLKQELVPLVDGALKNIGAAQAYGLNFNQPLPAFIEDVQKLNPNEDIAKIATTVQQDPTAALAVQGALFDVMSTASLFAKAKWLGSSAMAALKNAGSAVAEVASSDSSSSDVDQAQAELKQDAAAIVADLTTTAEAKMDQVKTDVASGVITTDQAIVQAEDQAAQLDALAQAAVEAARVVAAKQAADEEEKVARELQEAQQLVEIKEIAVKAAQDLDARKVAEQEARQAREAAEQKERDAQELAQQVAESQRKLSEFSDTLFEGVAKAKNDMFANMSASIQEMSGVISAQREKELQQANIVAQKANARAAFRGKVSANALLLADNLKVPKSGVITRNDVVAVLRTNMFRGHSIGSAEMRYLQGYLQGIVLQQKEAVSAKQTVPVVNLIRAIVRR